MVRINNNVRRQKDMRAVSILSVNLWYCNWYHGIRPGEKKAALLTQLS
jgi:hypothetical protein